MSQLTNLQWEERMHGLQQFIDECGVEYFDADEVVKRHAGMPPEEIWWHIIPTLKLLDVVRDNFHSPFIVTSGYRSPEYNKKVGGAPSSLHMRFSACDIWVKEHKAETVAHAIREILGRDFVRLFCGLGVYESANFIHFDTRGITQDMAGATWRG